MTGSVVEIVNAGASVAEVVQEGATVVEIVREEESNSVVEIIQELNAQIVEVITLIDPVPVVEVLNYPTPVVEVLHPQGGTVVEVVGNTGPQGPPGEDGADGQDGADGDPGPGLEAGGTAGQLVKKVDGDDYNTQWADDLVSLEVVLDGGGFPLATGVKLDVEIPFNAEILGYTALANQSGSIVVDVWKNTYDNFPPVDGNSITASAPISLSSSDKSQDDTLTGWTKTLSEGDILRFNIDSITSIERLTISLNLKRL